MGITPGNLIRRLGGMNIALVAAAENLNIVMAAQHHKSGRFSNEESV
jgi:hypothetical protein